MLSQELKTQIQDAYRQFLAARNLRSRLGQRLMIAEVANTLGTIPQDEEGRRSGEPVVTAIEAGTGTGKTVAYCLTGIPLAKAAGKRLVISTATVALQEQITLKDLPDIARHSGLSFSFALAKGRGRYLCLARLDALLQDGASQQNASLRFEEEGFRLEVDKAALHLFSQMLASFGGQRWNGDRDAWPSAIEDAHWTQITTDHSRCTGRHCAYFQQCAFYKAREHIAKADVIVANHDLVLSDLALGGGAILPSPSETLYIFDEGHHLPDKAINHFAHSTRLRNTADWLDQSARQLKKLAAQNPLPGDFGTALEEVPELTQALRQDLYFMATACESLGDFKRSADESDTREQLRYRFSGGKIPDELRQMGIALKQGFDHFTRLLMTLTDTLRSVMDGNSNHAIDGQQAEAWYPLFGGLLARAQENLDLWTTFTYEDATDAAPMARWLNLIQHGNEYDIEVSASPILAAETLRRHLWNAAFGALVTSATLTALGSFDRFRMRAGLPSQANAAVVPSPFQHADAGLLYVPNLHAEPTDNEAHTAAIIQWLPVILQNTKGGLVLFSSRRQMQDVFNGLADDWKQRVLVQGQTSRQETLDRHRTAIDAHQPSILFGLASFAEGIDLPGNYCEHVVIARLPFSVPNAPVEAALAEWIEARGGNPFMEIAVPDAAQRLVQACGRLLRTEQDSGTITILDRRLISRPYGRAILATLPPFKQHIDY